MKSTALPTALQTEKTDELDQLFSDFFKAQLQQPWPKAPAPAAAATSEPSELAASRTAEAPRNAPAPVRNDSTARARFTLAASVALALGACWYLSNGFQPTARPAHETNTPGMPELLQNGNADGNNSEVLKGVQEHKAKSTNGNNNKRDPITFE